MIKRIIVSIILLTGMSVAIAREVSDLPIDNLTVYPDASLIQPLQPGDELPTFNVFSLTGEKIEFGGKQDKPSVLISLRGGWCPYCNTHLRELRKMVPELRDEGVNVYFFSGDSMDTLYSSLSRNTGKVVAKEDYIIYSDSLAEAASALGIAYKVPDSLEFKKMTKDATENGSIEKMGVLPVPAVFVVDTSGTIAFSHANADFTDRLSSDEIRNAVDKSMDDAVDATQIDAEQ